MGAFTWRISSTTFTSPTALAWRLRPCRAATSSRARVLLRLLTVSPGVGQHVVGAGHQGVLLAEEAAVLAHQGQAVHVGIHADAEVGLVLHHGIAEVREVLGQRLGVVGELAVGSQYSFTTSTPKPSSSLGTATPPTLFTASTTTLNFRAAAMAGRPPGPAPGWPRCACGPCIVRAHAAQVIHRGEGEGIAFGEAQHLGA
jgi:hypothetical protein